ncbi:hypothetical protein [Ferrimonas sp. YFM]|uniref:hypothetical protein n=1 Tax=Ferrimonas sp. YFM TaxID=3028878 RepID=UPI00257471C6|nr:hypothetical protein [Ferrimonas sp. YFM]BDY03353.1 hypothetical protein F0521_03940 [Ferrimonas sp. YFM]
MNPQQLNFLSNSIEFLKQDLGRDEQILFLENCLKRLQETESLKRSELPELAALGNARDPKTHDKWLTKLCDLLQQNQQRLWEKHGEDLQRFPMLVRRCSEGGAGNETYFELEPIDPSTEPTIQNLNSNQNNNPQLTAIKYEAVRLKRTPWYLKLCNPLFESRRTRVWLLACLLISFWITPLVISAWLVSVQLYGHLLYPTFLWATITLSYCLVWRPIKNLLAVALRKVTLLEHVMSPYGSICISEVKKTNQCIDSKYVKRELTSFDLTANCPICHRTHKITKSISLEKQSLFNSRLIGVCVNNPLEHRFSFDKDTMEGCKIN